jgi:hypothetical protein
MARLFENDGVLSKVLAGLPRVFVLIAIIPEEKREHALEVAARELGYGEADAQEWAAAVMLRLRAGAGEGAVDEAGPVA